MKHIAVKYIGLVNPVYKVGKKKRRSNASLFVRELKLEEIDALRMGTKSEMAFTRDRAKILLPSC